MQIKIFYPAGGIRHCSNDKHEERVDQTHWRF